MVAETSTKNVFLSAGEASGDAYLAALVREMGGSGSFEFRAIGGPRSLAAGVHLVANSSDWGAIGIVQALGVLLRVMRGSRHGFQELSDRKPGLFIPIDFGFLNIRLCKKAKRLGWKVLYFVPPGSWRRNRQGSDLPRYCDEIVTPFEWSAKMLQANGANAHWFGHPLKQIIRERELKGSDVRQSTVAVLPGSRAHEIDTNLPLIAKALSDFPHKLEFAVSPTLDGPELAAKWQALTGREDIFTTSDTTGVLLRAHAGVICSGTATLEAAICKCPMVVIYEIPKASLLEINLLRMKRPTYISLPNIILDRMAVPEMLDLSGIKPADLRAQVDGIYSDEEVRAAQFSAFDELDALIGPGDCITRTALLATEMANSA